MLDKDYHEHPHLGFIPNDWKVVNAIEVCTKITDGTHDTPSPTKQGVPYIKSVHVKKGTIRFDDCLYLCQEDHDVIYQRCNPEKGDLLIVNIGVGNIGDCAYVDVDFEFSMKNIALLKPDPEHVNGRYLYHYYKSRQQKVTHSLKTGGAQPFLSLTNLKKLKVILPSLSEQRKIAKILSTWDKVISIAEALIDNSKQQKKSLMQQLLTGKKRLLDDTEKPFAEEWKEVKLGSISDISTGSSNREDSSLDGEYAFFDRSEDVRTSSRYLFDSEAVIVPGEGQDFAPKYFKGKFDLHQRTYAIMDFKKACGKFLFYYIGYYHHYFLSQAVGSTVKSLRLPMFQKMPTNLPSEYEQQKIAIVLTNADKKIDLLEQQLTDLKQEKKALMQQLLTGKRRVLVDS